jgi:archaellum component FlaF (FlaF/FlaG flagellin family)
MGFSTSASVVILAASLMYMATIFYPFANLSYHRVLDAKKNLNDMQFDKLNTKIVITNTYNDGGKLNITIYNNGSVTLNASKLNVIHNGTLLSASSFNVSQEGIWTPRNFINVTLKEITSGRTKIITSNGAADYIFT